MQRILVICLLMRLLAASSPSARAAEGSAGPDKAALRVAFGVLQKHKTSGGNDRYVLVDKDGKIRYSLAPDKELPLEANLGKPVQVVGKFDSQASPDEPLLVAQSDQAEHRAARSIRRSAKRGAARIHNPCRR